MYGISPHSHDILSILHWIPEVQNVHCGLQKWRTAKICNMESLVAMAASFCSQLLYCSAIYALIVRLWSFELFFVRNKLNLMLVFEIMGQFFCVSLGSMFYLSCLDSCLQTYVSRKFKTSRFMICLSWNETWKIKFYPLQVMLC